MVDDGQCRYREDEIRSTHRDGLQHSIAFPRPGHPEDVRRIIHQGVDARKLIEHRNRHREQDRLPVRSAEKGLFQAVVFEIERGLDFLDLVIGAGGISAQHRQHGAGLVGPALRHQPTRAEGRQEQEEEERRCGECFDPEHPAPLYCAKVELRDYEV